MLIPHSSNLASALHRSHHRPGIQGRMEDLCRRRPASVLPSRCGGLRGHLTRPCWRRLSYGKENDLSIGESTARSISHAEDSARPKYSNRLRPEHNKLKEDIFVPSLHLHLPSVPITAFLSQPNINGVRAFRVSVL